MCFISGSTVRTECRMSGSASPPPTSLPNPHTTSQLRKQKSSRTPSRPKAERLVLHLLTFAWDVTFWYSWYLVLDNLTWSHVFKNVSLSTFQLSVLPTDGCWWWHLQKSNLSPLQPKTEKSLPQVCKYHCTREGLGKTTWLNQIYTLNRNYLCWRTI